MEEKKKKIQVSLSTSICVIIIVVLLIGCVCLYFKTTSVLNKLDEKEYSLESSNKIISQLQNTITQKEGGNIAQEVQNTTENTNSSSDKVVNEIPSVVTAKKGISSKDLTINSLFDEAHYLAANLEQGKVTVWSKEDAEIFVGMGLVNDKNASKLKENESLELTGFSKKVIDLCVAPLGTSGSYEIVVLLMEDGTVEYADLNGLVTKGAVTENIKELKNIVKLQKGGIANNEGLGTKTMFAIDNTNTMYEIGEILSK